MSSCSICPRTAPDGHHACLLHAGELRAWLTELPSQARLLEAFVAAAGRPHTGRLGSTGRAHAPVPVDMRVLALLGPGHADPTTADEEPDTIPIRAFLDAWAGYTAYSYPAVYRDPYGTEYTRPCEQALPTRGASITGWCTWHLAYLPYALTHPWIGDFHRQLGDLIHRIRDLTHATPHHHPKAAPCPNCDEHRLAAIDGQLHITCANCGHLLMTLSTRRSSGESMVVAPSVTDQGPQDV
ncbi:hypothetical protein AB0903_33535, partial [Streptomyces sp. NPDC048389]|uniref:hypothetical protein n=1 Tax=Streptomyces sp. NPDC048389 TaxID=3154622 RepID=UPI0034573926